MKKVLLLLTALCALTAQAQYPTGPMTQDEFEEMLKNLDSGSISVGNACGNDNYMTITIEGDMDMNFNDLEILYAHITITGQLLNEGAVTLLCDSAIFEVLDGETLSIPEVVEIPKMKYKVYPNPAHEYVFISGMGLKYVYIYNLNGQLVKQYALSTTKNRIWIGTLPSGMYLLNIRDELDRTDTFKLIKR